MNSKLLSNTLLKTEALRLGFSHVGLAPAEPVPEEVVAYYEQWLREGRHGDMAYMEKYIALRRDPRLLLPGAKTVVSLAMSYNPGSLPTQPTIAWYAQGRDYHDVLRERLQQIVSSFDPPLSTLHYRICVDTAPIFERYWAWRCGLGWIGRHSQLVIPHEGSAFFLCELLLTVEFDKYDEPISPFALHSSSFCHSCHRCIDACPTGAITEEGMDARRCLSYLTIEHRGELPTSVAPYLRECFYGCDRCLRACPHLSHAEATPIEDFRPLPQLLGIKPADWHSLTPEHYRELFRGSAVKRAKYEGLMRNIRTADTLRSCDQQSPIVDSKEKHL